MYRITFLLLLSLTLYSCTSNTSNDYLYKKTIKNSINFFNTHAYDSKLGAYYSELDNEGKLQSKKIHTVALSRLIYSLSYSSKHFPENINKAKEAASFQLKHLIGTDSVGEFFIPNIESGTYNTPNQLDIWQQAYGLCGLSELYRNAPNKKLLKQIHQLHKAFVLRFQDQTEGGFVAIHNINKGIDTESKTLQALMYPITAYTANLWLADKENRALYEPIIKENLRLLYTVGWNTKTGWVNVKFDKNWQACNSPNKNIPCFTVSPGHNFQLAALLIRSAQWPFLTQENKNKYETLGRDILRCTLAKPIFTEGKLKNGFVRELNPHTDSILDHRKSWWQHSEALIALSLAKDEFGSEFDQLHKFFFLHFPDYENGNEYFFLDKNNKPITKEAKGSIGKSSYHTIEMIRFLEQ